MDDRKSPHLSPLTPSVQRSLHTANKKPTTWRFARGKQCSSYPQFPVQTQCANVRAVADTTHERPAACVSEGPPHICSSDTYRVTPSNAQSKTPQDKGSRILQQNAVSATLTLSRKRGKPVRDTDASVPVPDNTKKLFAFSRILAQLGQCHEHSLPNRWAGLRSVNRTIQVHRSRLRTENLCDKNNTDDIERQPECHKTKAQRCGFKHDQRHFCR